MTPRHEPRQAAGPDRTVGAWARVFNATYSAEDPRSDPCQPDFRGWTDPATGQPISLQAMQSWLATTVTRIRSLAPRRVLEIGGGTGNIALALAPHVDTYTCTDISTRAISELQERAKAAGLRNVRPLVLEAAHIDQLTDETFDTVVLNSVCQYFPHREYTQDVLRAAMRLVGDAGTVFVGDVRNSCLQRIEHAVIETRRRATESELIERVERAIAADTELVLAPSDFHDIAGSTRTNWVATPLLKPGTDRTLMTLFRYDVVLTRLTTPAGPTARQVSWAETGHELVRQQLQETRLPLWVTRVPNARILNESLAAGDADRPLIGAPPNVQLTHTHAIDPNCWIRLAKRNSYEGYILWNTDHADGAYSVLFDPIANSRLCFDPLQTVRRSMLENVRANCLE